MENNYNELPSGRGTIANVFGFLFFSSLMISPGITSLYSLAQTDGKEHDSDDTTQPSTLFGSVFAFKREVEETANKLIFRLFSIKTIDGLITKSTQTKRSVSKRIANGINAFVPHYDQ